MLSYEQWLEAVLEGRYVVDGSSGMNGPLEYVPALELTTPAHISAVTHKWLYPFYLDNVPASEFHSELYVLRVEDSGEWTLD